MATEDKSVKVTEEYAPDGSLIKKTKESPTKKTVSDWVAWSAQVLAAGAVIVSIVALAVGVYQFKAQQMQSAQMQATQVAASATQILDQEHQATLVGYLDDMSNLLLVYHLGAPNSTNEVRALEVARTFTAIRNLDGVRKGTLIRFLWAAQLINGQQPIISLTSADLNGAIFTHANLIGANLSNAHLSRADLSGADLSDATLIGADLSFAPLIQQGSVPRSRNASTQSSKTPAKGSQGANLSGVNLSNANLFQADLSGVKYLNQQQLDQVYSCKGATLPKGLTCHRNQ